MEKLLENMNQNQCMKILLVILCKVLDKLMINNSGSKYKTRRYLDVTQPCTRIYVFQVFHLKTETYEASRVTVSAKCCL